jgi:hypothetical protein
VQPQLSRSGHRGARLIESRPVLVVRRGTLSRTSIQRSLCPRENLHRSNATAEVQITTTVLQLVPPRICVSTHGTHLLREAPRLSESSALESGIGQATPHIRETPLQPRKSKFHPCLRFPILNLRSQPLFSASLSPSRCSLRRSPGSINAHTRHPRRSAFLSCPKFNNRQDD